ncbi:MAG TPA: hypothetical protein VF333_02640 [Pyrinomonadaceae bacterium]
MMPKSDPEARSKTSANSKDATTSVKTFISCTQRRTVAAAKH